jgi:hypothetical protein
MHQCTIPAPSLLYNRSNTHPRRRPFSPPGCRPPAPLRPPLFNPAPIKNTEMKGAERQQERGAAGIGSGPEADVAVLSRRSSAGGRKDRLPALLSPAVRFAVQSFVRAHERREDERGRTGRLSEYTAMFSLTSRHSLSSSFAVWTWARY